MQETAAITVRLNAEDLRRLEAEAERRGKPPTALAREFLHAALAPPPVASSSRPRRLALEALDSLARLTADLPAIDAVRVAQAARKDLERRPLPR